MSSEKTHDAVAPWTWPEKLLFAVYILTLVTCQSGELWCDEIWSLWNVEPMTSLREIFDLKLDNNHPLTSLWMILCLRWGIGSDWILRLPNVVFGIAFLPLIRRVSENLFGSIAARFALILTATSYFACLYFSEARGYGALLFFILAAFDALEQYRRTGHIGHFVLWQILGAIAVISHAGAYIFLAPALFRAVFEPNVSEENFRKFLRSSAVRLLKNLPLVIFALAWFFLFANGLQIGGSPIPTHASEAFAGFFVHVLGLHWMELPTWIALVLGIACLIAIPHWILWQSGHRFFFWILVSALIPLATVVILKPIVLVPRYFLATLPFFILILSNVLALGWTKSMAGKATSFFLTSVIILGNAIPTADLIHNGRGNFTSLLTSLVQQESAHATGPLSLDEIAQTTSISIGASGGCGAGPFLSFHRYSGAVERPETLHWVDQDESESDEHFLSRLDAVFLPGWTMPNAPDFKEMAGTNWALVGRATGASESNVDVLLYRRVSKGVAEEKQTDLP